MDRVDGSQTEATPPDWIQPPVEQEGLKRYVATLRERIWIVIATIVITTGIAILYVTTAAKVYTGATEIRITPGARHAVRHPRPGAASSQVGRPDPRRRDRRPAGHEHRRRRARKGRARLAPQRRSASRQRHCRARRPVGHLGRPGRRRDARRSGSDLSNAFAEQTIVEQTEELHNFIEREFPNWRASSTTATGVTAEERSRLSSLSSADLQSGPDPTLSVLTEATPPSAPISPKPVLSVVGGLFAGTILGIAAAFAVQVLDPRLRREEQLRRLYRLPILARIPREVKKTDNPIDPLALSPAASEAYRTLRGTLAVQKRNYGDAARVILVTGSSPSEGKTTTAVNLATSLAAAGNSVILMESDLRRPSIGRALGVKPTYGMVSVLIESIDLEDALVTTEQFGSNFGLLLADYEGGWISELFALPAARQLIEDAREIADYVIVDSPPLTDVVDALPLASYVDDVLLVVKLGKTTLSKLAQLGELLAENGIKPAGFTVVGTPRPTRSDYHYYGAREGSVRDRLPIGSSKS